MGRGWTNALIAALVACVVSFVLTPLVAALARRLGVVDRLAGRPLLGGVAIAAGTLLGVARYLQRGSSLHLAGVSAVALGASITLIAGLLDDRSALSPGHKFLWQVAATAGAGFGLALLGVHLDLFLHWP